MKLLTSTQNISGLKILLAAEFLNVPLDVAISNNSNEKTTLVVNDDCRLFSSNSAVWYLFSSKEHKKTNPQQDRWMEWESLLLSPEIDAFLSKSPNQLEKTLEHLDNALKNKFISGVSILKSILKVYYYSIHFYRTILQRVTLSYMQVLCE